MRNEMYISSEVALDRSSLHLWFLHRSGTSITSLACWRCDRDCLCSRFTLHRLLAVISLRIPWALLDSSHHSCSLVSVPPFASILPPLLSKQAAQKKKRTPESQSRSVLEELERNGYTRRQHPIETSLSIQQPYWE